MSVNDQGIIAVTGRVQHQVAFFKMCKTFCHLQMFDIHFLNLITLMKVFDFQ